LGVRDGHSYSWLTFKTIGDRVKNFGHGLRQLIEPRGHLAICSLNRPEWMITDFACMFHGIISVPIYRLFSERGIIHVINNTKVSVVVCDAEIRERFVKVAEQCPSLRHIVCMDHISDFVSGEIKMHCMNDIERTGSVTSHESVLMAPDDLITVLYTSGSSAFPKGIQVTELAFRSAFKRWCTLSSADHIYFSYRPLAWAADRDAVIATLICGGRTGFSTGDVACLMEELAMVRPSDFSCPPSICYQIHREFTTALCDNHRREMIVYIPSHLDSPSKGKDDRSLISGAMIPLCHLQIGHRTELE
jgi:long-chain acyl-CoA synthetase